MRPNPSLPLFLAAVGCVQGSYPPAPQLRITVTDPAGVEWLAAQDGAVVRHLVGHNCDPATWVQLHSDPPQDAIEDLGVFGWLAIPDAGGDVAYLPGVGSVRWNLTAAATGGATAWQGGVAALVTADAGELTWSLTDGELCAIGGTTDAPSCVASPGPVTVDLVGEEIDLSASSDDDGAPGWATDAATGDPVCGGEPPGT
ncbi:MAG: hypothetical protein ABMB14_01860 [Myxococcota bacterium]